MKKATLEDEATEVLLPSEFMRQLRPELYSDSTSRTSYWLKPEVFSHHLETLTERNLGDRAGWIGAA